jgi:hypothetical protein
MWPVATTLGCAQSLSLDHLSFKEWAGDGQGFASREENQKVRSSLWSCPGVCALGTLVLIPKKCGIVGGFY